MGDRFEMQNGHYPGYVIDGEWMTIYEAWDLLRQTKTMEETSAYLSSLPGERPKPYRPRGLWVR